MKINSQYLEDVFDPSKLVLVVNRTALQVPNIRLKVPFEAMAFTGMSGASMAFSVSYLTGIPLLAVRKDSDGSHHVSWEGLLEGATKVSTYMILDDGISSGDTVNRIVNKIKEKNPNARCVGILLWNSSVREGMFSLDYGYKVPIYSLSGSLGDQWMPAQVNSTT